MSVIIGLAGKARVGKDTGAEYLRNQFGIELISFAQPIKQVIQELFDLTKEHLDGDLKELPIPLFDKSPRELFQTLGTEWGRECVHPDIWVLVAGLQLQRLRAEYRKRSLPFPGAIFTDVRFENEANWIRKQGGMVLHIKRQDAQSVNTHRSESGVMVADGDLAISNNSSFEEFFMRLEDVVLGMFQNDPQMRGR